jgi:signal transduction histidine kinase
MIAKKILGQLNIINQCRKYGVGLWQCPQFLFLIMGLVIIGGMVASYILGNYYLAELEIVALIVLITTFILVAIAFAIARSFEKLAQVSRMKSEFISIVSHQLRDLLTISRIETREGLPLKKEDTYLTEVVKSIIKEFQPLIKATNVDVVFQEQKNFPKVLLDSSRIKSVIGNLLDNAIRYIKSNGKIKISLSKKKIRFYLKFKIMEWVFQIRIKNIFLRNFSVLKML